MTVTSTVDVCQLPFPDFVPSTLERQTPHCLDATIEFDEGPHVYRCQFDPDGPFEEEHILSASGFIHAHFPTFDADAVIQKMRQGRNFSTGKYAHMTDAEIKASWTQNAQQASARGTLLHFLLECHQNGYDLEKSIYRDLPDIQAYFAWKLKYFDAQGLVPFRTELRMRTDGDLRLTGTADLIAVARDHPPPSETGGCLTLHIIDWKFSKAIKKTNRYERGYGPCAHLDNCNYSHYLLQQNLYQWMLEQYFGQWEYNGYTYTQVRVASKHLAVFHTNHGPDGVLYMPLPTCLDTIEAMVYRRRQKLRSVLTHGTVTSLKRKRSFIVDQNK
jgi:hypothetical protein